MWGKFFSNDDDKKSASTPGALVHSDQLKRANEEIYKRSVELVEKNKILSLLDSLYDAVIHIVDLDKIAAKLSEQIVSGLGVFYCSVVLYHKSDNTFELVGNAAKDNLAMPFNKKHLRNFEGVDFNLAEIKDPVSVSVMDAGALLEPFFDNGSWFGKMAQMEAKIFHVHPLFASNEFTGLLMIGLNRDENQLSEFERKALPMVANMVALAIGKANVYEQLKEANFRLQELDQQKSEFMSIASHQLRTPLTEFKGFLELLGDGAYGKVSKEMAGIFGNLESSNEHLIKLVDEFLDVSRIEQGKTKYDFEVGDIRKIIGESVLQLKEKADKSNSKIIWHSPKALPAVKIDKEKMYHVVFNFIDNAIKYGKETDVAVSALAEDGGVAVRVVDTGLGFNKTDEVNFFQKMYRGENVKGVNVTGTGLGLFVCRKFIEAHGGRVWARSPGLGHGSEFGFWIPVGDVERGKGKEGQRVDDDSEASEEEKEGKGE